MCADGVLICLDAIACLIKCNVSGAFMLVVIVRMFFMHTDVGVCLTKTVSFNLSIGIKFVLISFAT